MFQHTKLYIYPFQNLSLGFILKIFLKFRKFQPRYSYKVYSYKKKIYSVGPYYRKSQYIHVTYLMKNNQNVRFIKAADLVS